MFHHRISLTLQSFWPICLLTRSWRRRGWWSTSKWWPTDSRRWSTEDSLTIYSWHRPEPAFRMVSWCEVREAVSKRYSCRKIVGSEEYDFSDISRCDPSIARTLPYWRRTHWWRRGGMSSSSNAGKFSFLWKTFELWKMFISVLWIMACYSRLYIQFNLIIGHNSRKVFLSTLYFKISVNNLSIKGYLAASILSCIQTVSHIDHLAAWSWLNIVMAYNITPINRRRCARLVWLGKQARGGLCQGGAELCTGQAEKLFELCSLWG